MTQTRYTWYKCFIIMLLCGLILLTGCTTSNSQKDQKETSGSGNGEEESSEKEKPELKLDSVNINGAVSSILSKMTLEEKIGQLFIVSTDSLDMSSPLQYTENMQDAQDTFQPGGIIFFSYNMQDRQQAMKLLQDLQSNSKIPLFLGIDEEGGSVQRLAKSKGMEVEPLPSMAQIGQTGDSANAYDIGLKLADSLGQLGFNLDFAPVADLCTVSDNTEIGERSFGDDPKLVADMVVQEVKALQENRVCATLKHFPGQGAVKEDTHKGFANLDTTIDKLRKKEFIPFEKGIDADVDFVMMSHVSVEPITQTEVPASLSKLMVQNILREELGFDGVIITDAMNMKIITKFYASSDASISAIKAGVDMILMPEDYEKSFYALLDAVKEGKISEDRIDDSVERILSVKLKRGIISLESN